MLNLSRLKSLLKMNVPSLEFSWMKLRPSRWKIAAHYSPGLNCRPLEVEQRTSVGCACADCCGGMSVCARCKTFRQTFLQGAVLVREPDSDRLIIWCNVAGSSLT